MVLAADDVPIPENNFLHALIKHIEVHVNGQLITRVDQNYAYKAFFQRVLNADIPNEKAGWLAMEGFSMPVGDDPVVATDLGVAKRVTPVKESVAFELSGYLFVDLFQCEKTMPPGCDIKLVLHLAERDFYFMDTTLACRLQPSSVKLGVRKITIADSFLNLINEAKLLQPEVLPFTRREINVHQISTGATTYNQENLFRGQLAVRYFIALIEGANYIGSATTSSMWFKGHSVGELSLLLDGQHIGYGPYKLGDGSKHQAYRHLLEIIGAVGDRASNTVITPARFKKGLRIYGFSRAPDLVHGEHSLPTQTGNLTLQITFKKPTTAALNVIVMAEYDSNITIDSHNLVTTNYTV